MKKETQSVLRSLPAEKLVEIVMMLDDNPGSRFMCYKEETEHGVVDLFAVCHPPFVFRSGNKTD